MTELKNKQTNNWITCEISIILSFFPPTLIGIANRPARSKVASGKWITKWNIEAFLIKSLKNNLSVHVAANWSLVFLYVCLFVLCPTTQPFTSLPSQEQVNIINLNTLC